MKLHTQTVLGKGGNCWSTCIASLLGVQPDDVPNFCGNVGGDHGEWMVAANEWLAPRGLMLVTWNGDFFADFPDGVFRHGVQIASGMGPRGHRHSVLWRDGKTLHDPHPSRDGLLGKPDEFESLFVFDVDAFAAHVALKSTGGSGTGEHRYRLAPPTDRWRRAERFARGDMNDAVHKASRGWPLCGRPRYRRVPGMKFSVASWHASDLWAEVTCKRCLAKRPKRRTGEGT